MVSSLSDNSVFPPLLPNTLAAEAQGLQVRLCADEIVVITIDSRTGRLNLRDTGDLAAADRGPRFTAISERLNENPIILFEALLKLRFHVRPILIHSSAR